LSSLNPSEQALRIVAEQQRSLGNIIEELTLTGDATLGLERLGRWKEMTIALLLEHVSEDEASQLKDKRVASARMGQSFRSLIEEARLYGTYLSTLTNKLITNPDKIIGAKNWKQPKEATDMSVPTPSKMVFLILGHDESNVVRLSHLLKTNWHVESLVLGEKPVEGTTAIEQLEGNVRVAAFAIALLSRDDLDEENFPKAHIAFELGWFYGRLGQRGVCVVLPKGSKIHPALNGIGRIEFGDSIEEIAGELQLKLEAVDMLHR
jgi:predicted nucleotide-binding protein